MTFAHVIRENLGARVNVSDLSDNLKQSFQERIARIDQSKVERLAEPMNATADKRHSDMQERRKIPVGLVIALIIAMGAVMVGNVVAFTYANPYTIPVTFVDTVVTAIGSWGVVAGIMIVVMIGLGLRDKPHIIGIAIGLPLMYLGEPYLAFLLPDIWVQLYSADHVDNMLIQAGLRMPLLVN